MGEVIRATDDLLRPVISDAQKARVSSAFADLHPEDRAALLVIADESGTARAQLAARVGKHWKVAAGGGFALEEKRPFGYIGIEARW